MRSPNRYYTLLIVPEKTAKVKRIVVPRWLFRSGAVVLAFGVLLAAAMIFDYSYVMSQIGENRDLKLENRRLRQQVQIFQNKVVVIESTLDRVKSFSSRLKVIMHVEEPSSNIQGKLPDANTNISVNSPASQPGLSSPSGGDADSTSNTFASFSPLVTATSGQSELDELAGPIDPEKARLQQEYEDLAAKMGELHQSALGLEEVLQDEYEVLYDKKSFLAALPTRQPASGYFTSGFGVRRSPIGDRVKMHEGLDIANRIGTVVRAPADGEVTFANSKIGYGHTVVLDHGYGIQTWFGHLKKSLVTRGMRVKRGTKIALLGNSGRSTGPHVHYEVRVKGYPVDPLFYIFEDSTP